MKPILSLRIVAAALLRAIALLGLAAASPLQCAAPTQANTNMATRVFAGAISFYIVYGDNREVFAVNRVDGKRVNLAAGIEGYVAADLISADERWVLMTSQPSNHGVSGRAAADSSPWYLWLVSSDGARTYKLWRKARGDLASANTLSWSKDSRALTGMCASPTLEVAVCRADLDAAAQPAIKVLTVVAPREQLLSAAISPDANRVAWLTLAKAPRLVRVHVQEAGAAKSHELAQFPIPKTWASRSFSDSLVFNADGTTLSFLVVYLASYNCGVCEMTMESVSISNGAKSTVSVLKDAMFLDVARSPDQRHVMFQTSKFVNRKPLPRQLMLVRMADTKLPRLVPISALPAEFVLSRKYWTRDSRAIISLYGKAFDKETEYESSLETGALREVCEDYCQAADKK